METGDEDEPQPPNIMGDTGVNFAASEKNLIASQTIQIEEQKYENAEDYVRRMMAENNCPSDHDNQDDSENEKQSDTKNDSMQFKQNQNERTQSHDSQENRSNQ